jgi:hypothetical protein
MATIFRKTDKGQAEIETRQYRLPPRLRTPLIMVDGRRTDGELRKVIGDPADEVLTTLLQQGFIEAIAQVPATAPAQAVSPAAAPVAARPAAAATATFEEVRRLAVRLVIDQLGPGGEALAIKIERARNAAELRQLLDAAHQLIRGARGSSAADGFASSFPQHFASRTA